MPNVFTQIVPLVVGRTLTRLRNQLQMARLVRTDFSQQAAQPGDRVAIPLPPATKTVTDVTPGPTFPANQDTTAERVDIVLDQWKEARFHISEKDAAEIGTRSDYIPANVEAAVDGLAEAINSALLAEAKKVGEISGTPGTTPFGSNIDVLREIARKMDLNKVPRTARSLVVDPFAMENAAKLGIFEANRFGSREVAADGLVLRAGGFDWAVDNQVQTHTAGSKTGTVTVSGAHSVGVKTITVATAASSSLDLNAGDIITFGSDDAAEKAAGRSYAVAAAVSLGASATGTVTLTEPLEAALSGGEAVNITGNHVMNVAFGRNAFGLAIRPPAEGFAPDAARVGVTRTITDPQTGLSMQLKIVEQYHQVSWYVSVLYGVQCLRPSEAVRLAG